MVGMLPNRMGERRAIIELVVLCLVASSCSATHAYYGKTLPEQELAHFEGFSTLCSGRLSLREFDGEFTGMRLKAPAGDHTMTVIYYGEPEEPSPYTRVEPPIVCIKEHHYQVKLSAAAKRRYTFDVDERTVEKPVLTVMESLDKPGQDRRRVDADVELISSRERCFVSHTYSECFP